MYLTLKNISKTYRSQYGKDSRQVLTNVNLAVDTGERVAIIGPSGSGKSTLLNIIGTLDRPDGGHIELSGKDPLSLAQDQVLELRSKHIGFIFQQHHLLPQCTLWENVLIPTLPLKLKGDEHYAYAERLLKETGLWELRMQKPAELSGGECQRAAVVRALINGPSLLLADEPTGSLDQQNALALVELLNGLNRTHGVAIIMVTHSLELARSMDKMYELRNGVLVSLEPER